MATKQEVSKRVRLKAEPSIVDDGNLDERVPDHGPNESAEFQMEGDAIEAFIKDKRIGLRIRSLRQKNGMGRMRSRENRE